MSLKESERIAIIVEYIRSGKVPDGYKIIESKQGTYRVQKAQTKQEVLRKKKERLEKQLEAITLLLSESERSSANQELSTCASEQQQPEQQEHQEQQLEPEA